ncbi:hypothetical protein [Aurantibacillus circumpalustris]|uniref:hypothetical protein n=1 Tax=Aurantibacillus circumpalustris TaxID=3036359 RepID=UPI00295BA365|nr:hypothetical protein [Aurantibacillus circumpalustris]
MGKDSKEMLRTILANTQLIMKHLNIDAAQNKKETKRENSSAQKVSVNSLAKRAPVKKKATPRK